MSLNYKHTKQPKELAIKIDKRGRPTTHLLKNGKAIYPIIKCLVAETFVPNPNNLPYVINIDGNPNNNYSNNLKWVDLDESIKARDARIDRKIMYEGKSFRTFRELIKHYGINEMTFYIRKHNGWTLEEAIKFPIDKHNSGKTRFYNYYGKIKSLKQISKITGVPVRNMNERMRYGWSLYKATETPVGTNGRRKEKILNG